MVDVDAGGAGERSGEDERDLAARVGGAVEVHGLEGGLDLGDGRGATGVARRPGGPSSQSSWK